MSLALASYGLAQAQHWNTEGHKRRSRRFNCAIHTERPAAYRTPERSIPLCRDCTDRFWKTMDETNIRRIAASVDRAERKESLAVQDLKKRTVVVTERRGRGLQKESIGEFPFVETANKVAEIKGTGKSVRVELADEDEAFSFRKIIYRYQKQRGMRFRTSIEGRFVWVSER